MRLAGRFLLKHYLRSHSLRMLIPEMPIGFHCQGPSVFVSEPTTNGRDINTAFNAPGCEQVAQVMPDQPMHPDLGARRSQSFVASCHRKDTTSFAPVFDLEPPWIGFYALK